MVCPLFYTHHLGIGFSILTLFGSLGFAACLGAIMCVIEQPLELPADCRLIACLLHPTAATLILAAKTSISSANMLLAIAVYAAMRRYSKARPSYFRRVSNFLKELYFARLLILGESNCTLCCRH